MTNRLRWAKILNIAGLVAMIIGAIDPLEGSVVILAGSLLALISAMIVHSKHLRLILWAFSLLVVGVATLFGLSAVGGIGGDTGRPMWLMVVFIPYPVGWVMGLTATIKRLKEQKTHQHPPYTEPSDSK